MVISTWSGKPVARLWSSTQGKSTKLRRSQYMNQDTVIGFDISVMILERKLREQRTFLNDLKNNRSSPPVKLEQSSLTINNAIKKNQKPQTLKGLQGNSFGIGGGKCRKLFSGNLSHTTKKMVQ